MSLLIDRSVYHCYVFSFSIVRNVNSFTNVFFKCLFFLLVRACIELFCKAKKEKGSWWQLAEDRSRFGSRGAERWRDSLRPMQSFDPLACPFKCKLEKRYIFKWCISFDLPLVPLHQIPDILHFEQSPDELPNEPVEKVVQEENDADDKKCCCSTSDEHRWKKTHF